MGDPLEIWTATECADFFKVKPRQFLEQIRYAVGFPEPIRHQLSRGRRQTHPRWVKQDVVEYVMGKRTITPKSPQTPESHASMR